MEPGSLESVLQRDRTVVGGALAGIVLLSWTYSLAGGADQNMSWPVWLLWRVSFY
jgi:predicted metal-binding membrane protein